MVLRLLFLLPFLTITGHAQSLQIVKDNVLCTFGLKDATGKWIVEPRFTDINRLENNCFRSFDGAEYGLLDESGKVLVEPQYDQLDYWRDCNCYCVRSSDLTGVLEANGRERIAVAWTFVTWLQQQKQFLVHQQTGDSTTSYFFNHLGNKVMGPISGAVVPIPWMRFEDPERETGSNLWLVAGRYTKNVYGNSFTSSGPYGLIDATGKPLLPNIYETIRRRDAASLWVVQSGKLGAVNLKGKTLIEPVYFPEAISQQSTDAKVPADKQVIIVRNDDHRYSLMDVNGKLTTPLIYDRIRRTTDRVLQEANVLYVLEQSGKQGYADEKGTVLVQARYDTLIPFLFTSKLESGLRKKRMYGFIAKNGDEYGVLGLNGDTLADFHYCEWLQTKALDEVQLLIRDAQLYYLTVELGTIRLKPVEEVGGAEHIRFFRIDQKTVPLVRKEHGWQQAAYNELELPVRLFQLKTTASSHLWFDERGEVFGDYTYLQPVNEELLLLQTRSGKRGVMRFPERTFVMDTAYLSLFCDVNRTFWAVGCGNSAHCWQAFDLKGKQLSATCFAEYFRVGDTLLVQSEGKAGVVLPDLTWLIRPAYKSLVKFGTTAWLVRGINGGVGAIDVRGTLLADTVYTQAEPVFGNDDQFSTSTFPFGEWWLLKRHSDSLLISSTGQTFSTTNQRKALLNYLDEAALQTRMLEGALHIGFREDRYREVVLKATYRKQLIASVRKLHLQLNRCNRFSRTEQSDNREERCSHSNEYFEVAGAGTTFYSLATVRCFTHYSMEEPGMESCESDYTNKVFSGGNWRQITLFDVFGKNETVLRNELQRAIMQLNNNQLPCYDPNQLVAGIRGFYLSVEGVHVDVYLGNERLLLLLPKSRLLTITTAKWLVPLLN